MRRTFLLIVCLSMLWNVARAINDFGQIVGWGRTYDDYLMTDHAFLLTPVPEPSSLVALGCGLLGLARMIRRRGD